MQEIRINEAQKATNSERSESYASFVKNLKIVNEMLAFEIKEKDFKTKGGKKKKKRRETIRDLFALSETNFSG